MTTQRRRCQRCGRLFIPRQPNHWYCDSCHSDIAPMGTTTPKRRPGVADRLHSGTSRVWAGRPLTLHRRRDTPKDKPSDTTLAILEGLRDFFTDIYRRPTRLSLLLRQGGLGPDELECLKYGLTLDALVLRFCPKLREWLIETIGMKATHVIIESYGLYGDERRRMAEIAFDVGVTESHARALRGWALKRLRGADEQSALKDIAAAVARDVLRTRQDRES